jgi:hypothetical protein
MSRSWLLAPLALALAAPVACSQEVDPFDPNGASCSDWNDEDPIHPVTVRIRNHTANPLYLGSANGGCQRFIDLFLSDASGEDARFRGPGSCMGTCEVLQEGIPGCTDDCPVPPTIYIAPGGFWEDAWSGNVYVQEEMPEGCWFDDDAAQPTCSRNVVAPAGSYTFTARAWPSPPECLDGECGCAPDVNGSCTMNQWQPLSGTPLEATGTLSFPADGLVEVVFD